MLLFLCALSIIALYILAIFWGRFWNPLLDTPEKDMAHWPDVDIVVPARDETDMLPETLPALLGQDYPGTFFITLVDDHSQDGTGNVARKLAKEYPNRLQVISAPDLPKGWLGKVAAMQAGVDSSHAPFILFTDADIHHKSFSLRQLVARAEKEQYDLTSLMVRLNCVSLAEKLLIPAFVFFFSLIYPFRKANDPNSKTAAAAGGVMLIRRKALDKSGGLQAIKDSLIDDCALARNVKDSGGVLCLTLTNDARSLRRYPSFKDVHDMIARTAFTQLRRSLVFLAGTLFALFTIFVIPLLTVLTFEANLMFIGGIAWFVMAALYAPTVVFYKLPVAWAISLPLATLFYMVAIINSARRAWAGQNGLWKGRIQES